jgi:hypothetical protein
VNSVSWNLARERRELRVPELCPGTPSPNPV